MVSAKKMAPAFSSPSRVNSIDSLGSSGDSVVPVDIQCATCSAISACTANSTNARQRPTLDARTRTLGLGRIFGASAATGMILAPAAWLALCSALDLRA